MAAGNPLAGIMARQLMAKLGGGAQQGPPQGGPPPQAGGPPQDQPDQAGMQIQTQLAELQGADPDSMMKILKQVKSQCVAIYPRAAFSIADAAQPIAQAIKYLDGAIKACEKAATVASTVSPIANGAGQPPQQQQQGLQQFAMGAQ